MTIIGDEPERNGFETPRWRSIWLIAFAGTSLAILIVANSPPLAFLLTMFGGAIVLPGLLNVCLIGIGWDALKNRLPKVALAIPCLVYGIYLLTAGYTWFDFYNQKHAIESRNARFNLAFDPRRDVLLDVTEGGNGGSAEWLVQNYEIQSAYLRYDRLGGEYAETFLAPHDFCELDVPGRVDVPARGPGPCLIYVPGFGDPRAIKLKTIASLNRSGMRRSRFIAVVVEKSGQAQTLTTGTAHLPGPIPLPVFICGANGDCGVVWLGPTIGIAGSIHAGERNFSDGPAELLASSWKLVSRKAPPPAHEPYWDGARARLSPYLDGAKPQLHGG